MSKSKYLSRTFNYAASKPLKWNNWIPAQGPTGRRNMVLGLLLKCSYSVDVATAVIQGEDLARLFFNVRISTHGGDRWNLSGEGSRIMSAVLTGPLRSFEGADVPVATPSTGEHALWIPFAKPFTRRWYDFAIGADVLREVEVTCPSQADLDLGTSAVTVNAATSYSVMAVTREADSIEIPCYDVVGETAMETLTQGTVHVGGGYLAEVLAYASGTPGGAAMTNWTEHRIPSLMNDPLIAADAKFFYGLRNSAAPQDDATPGTAILNDPIAQNRARVVHMLDGYGDDKLLDHPFIAGSIVVKATNTVADVKLMHRVIHPTPDSERARVARDWKVQKGRVKTAGKTRRNPQAWGAKSRYMPWSGE